MLQSVRQALALFRYGSRGQSMVEYGLIAALIAVAAVAAVTLLGSRIVALFQNIANSF